MAALTITPWPWRIDRHLGCIVGSNGAPIKGEADLALAAAAPELLEVLQALHERLTGCSTWVSAEEAYDSFYQEMVAEAMAKATAQQPDSTR